MGPLHPKHVSGLTVMIFSALPNTYAHRSFDLAHRVVDGRLDRSMNPWINYRREGHRLRNVECQIGHTSPLRFHPGGELLPCHRVSVIHKGKERLLVNRLALNAQHLSSQSLESGLENFGILGKVVALRKVLGEVIL